MSIESVYQSLLRRNPDQGAYSTYAGLSDDEIANAIYGSGEYADLQQQSQPQQQPEQNISAVRNGPQGGGGADANTVNQIYQQYLGRPADPSGLGTFTGMDTQSIINGILGSPEYAQSHQQPTMNSGAGYNPYTQGGSSQLSANPDPTQAFNFVASPYVTANNPFSSSINNAYQSLLGRPATAAEMGANSKMLQAKPDDYLIFLSNLSNSPEAAAAAASNKQQLIGGIPARIDPTGENSLPAVDPLTNTINWLSMSYPKYTPTPNMGGIQGFANKYGSYLPGIAAAIASFGGSTPLTAAEIAAGGAANYGGAIANGGTAASLGFDAANAGFNLGAAGANAASGGLDLGSNFTWNLPGANIASGGLDFGSNFTSTAGYPSFTFDSLLPLTPEEIAKIAEQGDVGGFPVDNPITSPFPFSPSDLSTLAKAGLTTASLAKLLGNLTSSSPTGKTSILPTSLPPALRNVLPTSVGGNGGGNNAGKGGGTANQAALPGIYREPFSPFAFGNQQPVQSGRNVSPTDFLANLNKSAADTSALGQMKNTTPTDSKLNFFGSLFS